MGDTMLTPNFTNFVTVLIMVAVGFAVLRLIFGGFSAMKKGQPTVGGMSNSPLGVNGN